jgi:hypothetical protein
MINTLTKDFFQELKQLAQKDLSEAHLLQHFTTAKMLIDAANYPTTTTGTWSATKPRDTLSYSNYTVSGKKYWTSGIPLCDCVVVPAQTPKGYAIVLIHKKYLNIEPVATMGMEDTLSAHFTCDQAPAEYLYQRDDPVTEPVDRFTRLSFISIQLGLSIAAFNNIDAYTSPELGYIKTKAKLDIETLNLLWNYELDRLDEMPDWARIQLVYSFGKKAMLGVAHLVTELTGSGLFQLDMPGHQRYKDLLIYTTHMRNIFTATNEISEWSF